MPMPSRSISLGERWWPLLGLEAPKPARGGLTGVGEMMFVASTGEVMVDLAVVAAASSASGS